MISALQPKAGVLKFAGHWTWRKFKDLKAEELLAEVQSQVAYWAKAVLIQIESTPTLEIVSSAKPAIVEENPHAGEQVTVQVMQGDKLVTKTGNY